MRMTATEDPLEDVRRRIDQLHAFARSGSAADQSRTRRHLNALQQEEATALAAARAAPEEIDEKLGQLRIRLAVAEKALLADLSDDWTRFAAAVEDELRSWDIYLERVQATTAAKAGSARERAEAAIAEVRAQRIAVHERLAQAREDLDGARREQRNHVSAARTELERKADELTAKISGGSGHQ